MIEKKFRVNAPKDLIAEAMMPILCGRVEMELKASFLVIDLIFNNPINLRAVARKLL